MKPAFKKDGFGTAGNASIISDGAAAVVVMAREKAEALGCQVLATVGAQASAGIEMKYVLVAPILAVPKCLEKEGISKEDVDLYEINEAFAVVAMAALRDVGLDHARVNVNGGACALGHPIGATGARITTTLIYALRARGLKRGIASLCIGGGEATAIAIEII